MIVGAETLSRIVDPEDRATVVLFGDGAGAAVLTRTARRRAVAARLGPRLRRFGRRTARDPGRRQPPARVDRDRRRTRSLPEDAGPARCSAAPCAPSSTPRTATLERAGATRRRRRTGSSRTRRTSASSKRPRSASASRPSARIVNIERYGNTSSASIPLALFEGVEDGRVRDGDLVLLVGLRRRHDLGQRAAALGCAMSDDARRVRDRRITRHRPRDRRRSSHAPAIRSAFCYGTDEDGAHETVDRRRVARRQGARRPRRRDRRRRGRPGLQRGRERARTGARAREQRRYQPRRLLVRMTDEQWQAVLDTNLTGAFHTIRARDAGHDEGPLRSHRQRVVGRRPSRHGGPGQLRGRQSRASSD